VDEHGAVVQLRGMSFGWSQWWGQYWTAGTVSWLVDDWKVEIVRTAMGIESDATTKGYLDSPATEKAKVVTVIEEALRRGIYVIVDWHDHHAPSHTERAKAFFSEMAVTYGHYPNVIWEIFNEPADIGPGGSTRDTWPIIKSYAEQVIPAIRAKDPDNLIIVGTPEWSQRVDQASQSPISDPNVAYTLHFYAATHKQYLRDYASQALGRGVALFVTEWGTCEASGTGYLDAAETDTWLRFLDDNKLSSANWDIADKPNETCSALLPNRSTTGGWSQGDLTESGRLVRRKLREYAGFPP
jgi:endoglucanase